MATKHVYIYCRISADQQGRAEGVQAQERWGREYAAQTWPGVPVRVFSDNDLSAAKDDVVRPAFNQMREGVRRGECAHLWSVEQSRLARIETVWFSLVAELIKAGVTEVHTKRDGMIRLDDVVGGIKAVLSADEVRKLRKRVIDKKAELARQGRPGNLAGFGFRQRIYTKEEEDRLREWRDARNQAKRDGADMGEWKENHPRPAGGRRVLDEQGRAALEIVPEQAEIIRQAAALVLNGNSLTSVAAWLNQEGIRGLHGARIYPGTIAGVLTAPSVAGLRVHQGEIVGKGTWEPILDEATWRALRAVIGSRKRSRHRVRRSYLLAGRLMFCGKCGEPMYARAGGHGYYACNPNLSGGCGDAEITVDRAAAEAHIAVQLFLHLEKLDAAGMLSADEHANRRDQLVNELRAFDGPGGRRAEISRRWAAGKITIEQFDIMNAALDGERERIESELRELPAPAGDVSPGELREAWPEMTLDEQRKVVDDWIEKIVVHRAARTVTMKTIAERAGVTDSTVWRVFHQECSCHSDGQVRYVSAASASRIRDAAAQLGYQFESRKQARPTATDPSRMQIFWRR